MADTGIVAPLEAIGLFGFAWTSLGPQSNVHWIAPMIFSVLVGIANVSYKPMAEAAMRWRV